MKFKKSKFDRTTLTFLMLLTLVLVLTMLNVAKATGLLVPAQPEVKVVGNTIVLADLSLEQKIAQMVVVAGNQHNLKAWKDLQIGGIHLFAMQSPELFSRLIAEYQEGMTVPFFVTADLEGCLNPFAYFKEFPAAKDIKTLKEAFQKGVEEGRFLHTLGFTVNFAPVVDLEDQIWKCRAFPGNKTEITAKASAYIEGLQGEGIVATAKHYPGKTLQLRDPHKFIVTASIDKQDLYPYSVVSERARAVMVSHLITLGELDSGGVPSVTSKVVIRSLPHNFTGLIISDEINMLGLRSFYSSLDEMYIAVFTAGNDIVLNFNEDPNEIYRMIQVITKAVEEGEVSEEWINRSVRKILEAKGFTVQ